MSLQYPVHICLVSNQPIPSLAPLLDPALGVEKVILVAMPGRVPQAQALVAVLERYGIQAEIRPIEDGYKLATVLTDFALIAAFLDGPVAVNITGGSKIMTLAAWDTFATEGNAIYYVQFADDSIDWLYPESPSHQLADRLGLEGYLMAHGYTIRSISQPQRHNDARLTLAYDMLKDKGLQRSGNTLRHRLPAGKARYRDQLQLNDRHWARFNDAGMLQQAADNRSILTKAGRIFLSGEWLELAVYAAARQLQQQDKRIQDVATNLIFQRRDSQDSTLENELDVVVLRNNTLYMIECKTSGYEATLKKFMRTAIYKLDMLRSVIGGMRGCAVLVTMKPLDAGNRARAGQLGIEVLDNLAGRDIDQALSRLLQHNHYDMPG